MVLFTSSFMSVSYVAYTVETNNRPFLTVLLPDLESFMQYVPVLHLSVKTLGGKKWLQASFIGWQVLFYSYSITKYGA